MAEILQNERTILKLGFALWKKLRRGRRKGRMLARSLKKRIRRGSRKKTPGRSRKKRTARRNLKKRTMRRNLKTRMMAKIKRKTAMKIRSRQKRGNQKISRPSLQQIIRRKMIPRERIMSVQGLETTS